LGSSLGATRRGGGSVAVAAFPEVVVVALFSMEYTVTLLAIS